MSNHVPHRVLTNTQGAEPSSTAARMNGLDPEEARGQLRVRLVVNHLKGGGKEQCVVTLANTPPGFEVLPVVVYQERVGALGKLIRRPDVPVDFCESTLSEQQGPDPDNHHLSLCLPSEAHRGNRK